MSEGNRAIVPLGQRGVVASVNRQLAITEKLVGKLFAGGALSFHSLMPDLVVQAKTLELDAYDVADISHNGRFVLSTDTGCNVILLWDASNNLLLKVIGKNLPQIREIYFFPNSHKFAVTIHADRHLDPDYSLRFWDLTTATCYRQFIGHENRISWYNISEYGLLTGDNAGIIKKWDILSGVCLNTYELHTDLIYFLKYSQDSSIAISGSYDGTFKIWKIANGECLHIIHHENTADFFSLAFLSDNDNRLTIVDYNDGYAENSVFDITSGQLIESFETEFCNHYARNYIVDSIEGFVLCKADRNAVEDVPDDPTVVSDEIYMLYNCVSGTESEFVLSCKGDAFDLKLLSAGGHYILFQDSGHNELLYNLWELAKKTNIGHFSRSHSVEYKLVTCSYDGNHIVATGRGRHLHHWDLRKGQLVSTVPCADLVSSIAFTKNNNLLISQYDPQQSLFSWQEMHPQSAWPNFRGDVAYQLCDIETGRCLKIFENKDISTNYFATLAFLSSVSGSRLFAISSFGTLFCSGRTCRIRLNGSQIQKEILHLRNVTYVVLSSDNKRFATGCADKFVRVWNLDGELFKTLQGHERSITTVKFSASGDQLISASEDRTIRLWDVETGVCLRIFSGHNGSVIHASFTNNGQQIISASHDGTIRFWEVKTGVELARCYGFDDGNWAVVAPDGRYDSSNGGDCPYLRWTVEMESYPVEKFKEQYYTPGLLVQVRANCCSDSQ